MAEQQPFFVFLVRHAERSRSWQVAESDHSMENWGAFHADAGAADTTTAPGKKGLPKTLALAGSLCDQLALMGTAVTQILHSEHRVAAQTAEVYREALQRRFGAEVSMTSERALTPSVGSAVRGEVAQAQEAARRILALLVATSGAEPSQGVLVIGHQPHLTYIAQGLLKPARLPVGVLPLSNSEVACIRLGERPALLWCLTEHTPELATELKAKIASKFDVAKFILGALILNLSLYLASDLWQVTTAGEALLLGGAMVAAFLALGFTIATLFAYDRLNMPKEFWGSGGTPSATPRRWSVSRPPSAYQLILFYEMIHAWNSFFLPAVAAAIASLVLLVAMLAYRHYALSGMEAGPALLLLGAILLGLIISVVVYQAHKPKLGFDD